MPSKIKLWLLATETPWHDENWNFDFNSHKWALELLIIILLLMLIINIINNLSIIDNSLRIITYNSIKDLWRKLRIILSCHGSIQRDLLRKKIMASINWEYPKKERFWKSKTRDMRRACSRHRTILRNFYKIDLSLTVFNSYIQQIFL